MANPQVVAMFEDIYSKTKKAVHILIASKCKSTADIADIFQDTYMELYQVLCKRGVGYIANDRAFVIKLARRKIAKYYSLLERIGVYVSIRAGDDAEGDFADFCADDFIMDEFHVEDFVVDQVLLSEAKQFIESQPDAVQKVFYLHYEADLTIVEIARVLGMTESNVKNKLYRTLKVLRGLMVPAGRYRKVCQK